MHQFKGETEVDTLRKLETFNWNRQIKVSVIISDSETAHQEVTKDTSSVANGNPNHSPDSSKGQCQSNTRSNEDQSPHFQITRIGPPNYNNVQKRLTQQNEDIQESYDSISHNLILISRKYTSVTQTACNYNQYVEFKNNIFTLMKSRVSKIIVPRVNDSYFVRSFLIRTKNIGLIDYNYSIPKHTLETLFWQMLNSAKQQVLNNESSSPHLNQLENITVSSFFTDSVTNINTSHKEKRRKLNQGSKGKANERNNSGVHDTRPWDTMVEGIHFPKNDNYTNEQQAVMNKAPPPYFEGLKEVAMSPDSLNGDNDTRQLSPDVPVLSPSISFVTSLSPDSTPVSDGKCRLCNRVTNRICLGCSKMNVITYYCSQLCQEYEWPRHMFRCSVAASQESS